MTDSTVTPEDQLLPKDAPQTEQPEAEQEEQWLTIGERTYDRNAAQKKIVHADTHIQTLEQELAEARKQLEERELQEKQAMLQEKLNNQSQQPTQEQPASTETPAFSMEELEARLFERFESKTKSDQEASQREQTLSKNLELAQAKYGTSHQQKLKEIAEANELSREDVLELASTKPKAFQALFGLTDVKAPTSQRVPESTSVTPRLQNTDDPIATVARQINQSKSSREKTDLIKNLLATAR